MPREKPDYADWPHPQHLHVEQFYYCMRGPLHIYLYMNRIGSRRMAEYRDDGAGLGLTTQFFSKSTRDKKY